MRGDISKWFEEKSTEQDSARIRYLLSLGLVWPDTATVPSTLGLTNAGSGYATD